jgi:predicted acylesterase/phospholipase RssA
MKYLSLGPGGHSFFAMLGQLKKLETENKLDDLEEISGASAGSLIATGIAIGHNVDFLMEQSVSYDFSNLFQFSLKSLLTNYGFMTHSNIRSILVKLNGCDPRFKDLKKKLHVSALCIDTLQTEYFSVDTHPDMFVLDAVCMSISLPFVFVPFKYNGRMYIDGGTCETHPSMPFIGKHADDVLAIYTVVDKPYGEVKTFTEYLMRFIQLSFIQRYDFRVPTVQIDIGAENSMDRNMSVERRLRLFSIGYRAH